MLLSEFVRLYPLRAKQIAWFFGAGTSVSAGMPTANDLVWEFKRRIYCSEERYDISLFNNLSDPAIRNQIQSYFDSKQCYPAGNSVDEYSVYFEKAYPSASDRSTYLMQQLQGMQNSFGHRVVGVMMKNDLIRLIFTTNFDKAFENAAVGQFKTMDNFFVATLDNTTTAIQKYYSDLRPFITKIHGDYFSEKLKNTTAELQEQDIKLRDILYLTCLSNGLGVMGYSGRDESIMEVFNKALDQETSFPNGIFWFIRPGSNVLPSVLSLIEMAKSKGIQAELVEVDTFDTCWAEIIKGVSNLPLDDLQKLNINYLKLTTPRISDKGSKYPFVRFNGSSIAELPMSARLLKCEAGNTKEIREKIKNLDGDLLVIRKKSGIIGFGADSEFERIFASYGTLEKDVFQIPDHTLNYDDSTIKGLLAECLIKAISRNKPLMYRKRRDRYLIMPDPQKINDHIFTWLKNELDQQILGKIPGTNIQWVAGIEIELQKKLSNYFMIVRPAIIASKTNVESDRAYIAPFIKEFTARWYNIKYARLLEIWLDIIFSDQKEINISSFDETITGFNAKFKLKRSSPFTKST